MEQAKPYVFLDVDGVLNPWRVRRFTQPKDAYQDFEPVTICNYSMFFSQSMANELEEVTSVADVLWLTTWLEEAPLHVAPHLQLPDWPWLDWNPTKLSAVQQTLLHAPRPFVWLDDEEATTENVEAMREHLNENGVEMPSHLTIRRKDRTGLTRTHVAEVGRFLNQSLC